MAALPYVTLSCAISLDGYLDAARPSRLAMSNPADLDRVDALRAESDAVMVGASTIRRDDCRLLVKSEERRAVRTAAGRPASPTKVTVTSSGAIPPESAFLTAGDGDKLVYCPSGVAPALERTAGGRATIVGLGERVTMADVVADLGEQRGVRRLMVEGGGSVLTQFLAADLVDELQLVVAPFFVGEEDAPRFVGPSGFPWTATHRAPLVETRRIGDVVLMRYALSGRTP